MSEIAEQTCSQMFLPHRVTKVDPTAEVPGVCSLNPMMLHSNTRKQQAPKKAVSQ